MPECFLNNFVCQTFLLRGILKGGFPLLSPNLLALPMGTMKKSNCQLKKERAGLFVVRSTADIEDVKHF